MTKKKRIAAAVTSCALLGAMALGGTMAYLTDSEKQTNEFTFGKVEIDLVESTFAGNATIGTDKATYNDKLVPYAIADKDPTVYNTGDADAVVFVKVVIPKVSVIKVNADGSKANETATSQQIFTMMNLATGETTPTAITTTANSETYSGSGWYVVSVSDNEYVFGYKEALTKETGSTTTSPFNKVQLINMTDDSYKTVAGNDYASTQSINVYAYGIQATGLDNITYNTSSKVSTSDGLSAAELNAIWTAYTSQNGTDNPTDEANTAGKKDLKGDTHPAASSGD